MNLTIIQLILLHSSYQVKQNAFQPGIDLSLSTKLHNIQIRNSKFSYFTSELIKNQLNSANILIQNSNFDHFLSPSITISTKSVSYSNETFNERIVFPATTTKIKFKNCMWSNFFSSSDEGGCFGIQGIAEATITGCSFINVITYTKYTTGKGAFMIITNYSSKSNEFTFKNNKMINVSSINSLNASIYHAFYVINKGSSSFSYNSMNLLSKGGSYSCLLQSLSSTSVSYSNFTNCDCKIGSGMNIEFFDKSSTKVRDSLFSKLGGVQLLRFSCAEETFSDSPQPQSAKVSIEDVYFIDNDGPLLIALNNRMGSKSDQNLNSNFGIRFVLSSSAFFGNSNMTYPFYVKVPKSNLFSISEFEDCISDSKLIVQPEIKDLYYYTLKKGWTVISKPTEKPSTPTMSDTFTETVEETPVPTSIIPITIEPTTVEPTSSPTPKATPTTTPKISPTKTPPATPTPEETPSRSPSPSSSPSASDSPSASPKETPSASPFETPSFSPKMTPSATPTETPSVSPEETPSFSPEETASSTPEPEQTIPATPNPTVSLEPTTAEPPSVDPTTIDRVDIVTEGSIFTTTEETSTLLIEGSASINIDSLQDLQFSSYNGSSDSEINLFGRGIDESNANEADVELTVKDFNNVTINVFNSRRDSSDDQAISLPIVVSEVSNFEINNGYSQNEKETEISIKSIIAPTQTKDLSSHITSNSRLNVKFISFSGFNTKKRLHQTVTSHSKYKSKVDSIFITKNVEAELVNFTVNDEINISQKSQLKLKQTNVNFHTIIGFEVDSLDEAGQIYIENQSTLNSIDFDSYSFSPNRIKLRINNNSISDKKFAIIKGITDGNCKQMFVNFLPPTNFNGDPYRSSCEDNQLFVSIGPISKGSVKSKRLNNGIIALAVLGSVISIGMIVTLIYIKSKKIRRIIDPSDAFDISMGNNPSGIYN